MVERTWSEAHLPGVGRRASGAGSKGRTAIIDKDRITGTANKAKGTAQGALGRAKDAVRGAINTINS
jgi:hypothetical protein